MQRCDCGSNVDPPATDIGYADNWPLFPLVSLQFAATSVSGQRVNFRVGPLVCKQGKLCWDDICLNSDGLVQERRKSIVLAMELRFSCTNPAIRCSTLFHQSIYYRLAR